MGKLVLFDVNALMNLDDRRGEVVYRANKNITAFVKKECSNGVSSCQFGVLVEEGSSQFPSTEEDWVYLDTFFPNFFRDRVLVTYKKDNFEISLPSDSYLSRDILLLSSNNDLLGKLEALGCDVARCYQEGEIGESDLAKLRKELHGKRERVEVRLYVDIDGTLLNRPRSFLDHQTILNTLVIERLQKIHKKFKKVNVVLLTARCDSEYEQDQSSPTSTASVERKLLELTGMPVEKCIFTTTLENGRYVSQKKIDTITDDMKDRSDVFVVFIDDDREHIALAKEKRGKVPFTIVPMLVHEQGHLPEDASHALKAALKDAVQAEVPLFVGPASCRFAFGGKEKSGSELPEKVITASMTAASGGS